MNKLKREEFFQRYRFEILAIALSINFLLPEFSGQFVLNTISGTLSFTLLVISGLSLVEKIKKRTRRMFLLNGLILIMVQIIYSLSILFPNSLQMITNYGYFLYLLYFAFFVSITYHLFLQISRIKTISQSVIVGALAGYLLIGTLGFFVFMALEMTIGGTLSNLNSESMVKDIYYYSFVTLTTIGYGDITPLHNYTRDLSVFLGVIGQFYLTVTVASLVSKYLSQSKQTK
ncbi:potassium channel family protein [Aureibacter tunicatorum]|uniref:Neutral ceramidase superfamily lipid hydrolase n=1 Tax=Aureibacter tunicatorum TaxID=866807 RepID=A0AAE4BQH4_9BACT|nr:potassium channel family protein [Aureibacter tunicatorum]MDR6239124.1 putative neutral ceramidase superfamily lipid hydrolase [Aureibacter tunicatorum]BDD04950.1 hypothetical protein AUTU_24330 [Aureibacter tunicatorum]